VAVVPPVVLVPAVEPTLALVDAAAVTTLTFASAVTRRSLVPALTEASTEAGVAPERPSSVVGAVSAASSLTERDAGESDALALAVAAASRPATSNTSVRTRLMDRLLSSPRASCPARRSLRA
jgi:hypothetical protein